MAAHVLPFPTRSGFHSLLPNRPSRLTEPASRVAAAAAMPGALRPHLVPARTHALSQPRRIAQQIQQELAGRVQREAFAGRAFGGRTPPQVTEVSFRQRLLDTLFFFAHPA